MVLRRKSLKLSNLSLPYLVKVGHFGYWKYPGARVRKPYPSGETYNLPKFRSKAIRGTTEPKEARAVYNQPRSRVVLPSSALEESHGLPEYRSKAVKQAPQPAPVQPTYKEPPAPKPAEPVIPPILEDVIRATEERRAQEVKPTAARVRTESRAPSISLRRGREAKPTRVAEEPVVEERKPTPSPERKPAPRPVSEREVAPEPRAEEPPPRRVEAPREVEVPPEEAREVRRPERRGPTPAPKEELPPIEEPREELPPPEREAPPEERDPVQDLVEYVESISEDPEAPPEYRAAVDEIVRSAEAGNYANIPEIVNELPPDENLTNLLDQIIEQYVPPTEREAPPPTEEPARVGRPVAPEVRPSRLREGEEPPVPRVSAEEAADAIATAQEGGVTPESQRQVQAMLQDMPPQELARLGEQLGSTGETPEQLINDIMASAGAPPAEEERRAAREEFIDSYLNEIRSQIRSIAGGETDVRNAKDAKLANNLIGDAVEAGDLDSALDAVDNYLVAVDPQGNDIRYNPLREMITRLNRLRESEIEAETREAQGGIPAERALGVAPEIRERVSPRTPVVGRGRIAEGRPPERRPEAEATPFPEAEPAPPTPEPELGRAETRRKLPSPEELRERYKEKPKEVRLAEPSRVEVPSGPPTLAKPIRPWDIPLPTEEELKTATIVPLIPGSDIGQVSGPVSKVTVKDKNYFIKESTKETSLNEVIASKLGELVGVIFPKSARIDSPYPSGIISPWIEGKPLDLFSDPDEEVKHLPKEVVARHLLFSYIVEDVDAHYGQYIIAIDGSLIRVDAEHYFHRSRTEELDPFEEEVDPKVQAAWTIARWNALYGGIGGSSYAVEGMGNNFSLPHNVINDFLDAGPELVRIIDEAGKTEAAQGVSQRLEWLSQIQDNPNPTIGDFLYRVLGWEEAKPPEPTLREKIEAPTPPLERKGEGPLTMGPLPNSPPIEFPSNSSIVRHDEFTPELAEEVLSYAERFANSVGRDSGLYPGYGVVVNDFSEEAGVPYHSYIISRDSDGDINGLMLFQDYLISVPGQEAVYVTNILSRLPVTSQLFREAARESSSRDVPLVVAAKKLTLSDVEPADLAEKVGIYSFDKSGRAVLLSQYAKVFAETGVVPNILDKFKYYKDAEDLRRRIAGGRPDATRKLKRDLRDIESQLRALEKIITTDPLENNAENKGLARRLLVEWRRIKEQINHEEAPRTDAGRKLIQDSIEGGTTWNRDTGDLQALPVFDPKTGKSRDLGVVGAYNEAVDFIDRIISRDVYLGPREIKAKSAGETRSFYDSFDQSINLNPNSDAGVVVHEIFHYLANIVDNWERLCYEFMMCFTTGQVPESLNSLYPDRGYRDDEFVRRVDIGYFTGSASWYLGKIYRDGTTEIPAMLGQALFNDPVGFCNLCPLGATFILALIMGEVRNEIEWDEEEAFELTPT